MRYAFGFGSPTPNVTRFLIIIIATYLVFALFGRSVIGAQIYHALMLSPREVVNSFEVWRLLTYAFLHDVGSPMHVIFNALLLYMMGPQLEDRWGENRFLLFTMTAILLGGVLVVLTYLVGISNAVVVGFSAATVGLVVAWGLTFTTQQIFLLGIVPITGKQLVYVTVGLEILYAVSSNSFSSAAHFGGIIAGFIFTLGLYKPSRLKQIWRRSKNQLRR
jgi:membrane associated rhomboid family serine protease